MNKYEQTSAVGAAQLLTAGIIDERRAYRVKWDQAVVTLARWAAFFSFCVGSALAGLGVVMFNYTHWLRPLNWKVGLIVPLLAGAALAGIMGLIILVWKDHDFDYDSIRSSLRKVDPPPLAQTGPRLVMGPLERVYNNGSVKLGRLSLTADQKLSLAQYVVEDGKRTVSGRLMEEANVIQDRNGIEPGSGGKTTLYMLQEDLIRLDYADRLRGGVEINQRGYDYLELLIPRPDQ